MSNISRLSKAALAALALLASAQHAEASRFRIFGIPSFGSRETIDLVYDLPDRAPYIVSGEPADVGYLNSNAGNAYVLYRGERYTKLDAQDIAILTQSLGFDPTAKHRAQYAADHAEEIAAANAAAKAERDHKDQLIAEGKLLEPMPGEAHEDWIKRRDAFIAKHRADSANRAVEQDAGSPSDVAAAAPSPASGTFGFLAVLVILVVVFRKQIARVVSGLSSDSTIDLSATPGETNAESFDQAIAKRLAELNAGPAVVASSPAPSATPAYTSAPAARGFGRKAV